MTWSQHLAVCRTLVVQAYAESSMRLYHPLVLEVVSSILSEAANTKEAVKGYARRCTCKLQYKLSVH